MGETNKTNAVRNAQFFDSYLTGKIIDIGYGGELVVPHAEGFDIDDGDANTIDLIRDAESYDCVHSCHCLEHMHDPVDAIGRWWKLVKPGGHFIVVVPDEDLYEQGAWPSRFNDDHKATFRLNKDEKSWSPCSHDIGQLVGGLPGAQVISAEIQDKDYNRAMMRLEPEGVWPLIMRHQVVALYHHLEAQKLLSMPLLVELNKFFWELGSTVDQTMGPALAQIEVVAQKSAETE